jgi:Putative endonuclease, protein of unknown function (DUF1780)
MNYNWLHSVFFITRKLGLAERRRALEESVDFFSSKNKLEREKWVVGETITNLGIEYSDDELVPVSDEPPDVRFRGAEFELKEIMDPDRPRHLEYKKALQKARATSDPVDLLQPFTPRDVTLTEIYEKLLGGTSELRSKYAPATCRNLDLLFYVNLEDVMGLVETPFSDVTSLRSQPWRSVTFLMGRRTCVLVARDDAPEFLKAAVGRVIHREDDGV